MLVSYGSAGSRPHAFALRIYVRGAKEKRRVNCVPHRKIGRVEASGLIEKRAAGLVR